MNRKVNVQEESDRHEDAKREFAALDFSLCHFPSDRLTILNLRQLHPKLFDHGFHGGEMAQPQYYLRENVTNHVQDGVGFMLFRERLIATCAYAAARGLPSPRGWDLQEQRGELIASYCEHRLATGVHKAEELVRDIERQGAELAKGLAR